MKLTQDLIPWCCNSANMLRGKLRPRCDSVSALTFYLGSLALLSWMPWLLKSSNGFFFLFFVSLFVFWYFGILSSFDNFLNLKIIVCRGRDWAHLTSSVELVIYLFFLVFIILVSHFWILFWYVLFYMKINACFMVCSQSPFLTATSILGNLLSPPY